MSDPHSNTETSDTEYREEWLSAYLDDELSSLQRQIVEERLQSDESARVLLSELEQVRSLVGQLPSWNDEMEPVAITMRPADAEADAGGDYHQDLSSHAVTAVLETEIDHDWTSDRVQRHGRRWNWMQTLALAAIVVLVVGISGLLRTSISPLFVADKSPRMANEAVAPESITIGDAEQSEPSRRQRFERFVPNGTAGNDADSLAESSSPTLSQPTADSTAPGSTASRVAPSSPSPSSPSPSSPSPSSPSQAEPSMSAARSQPMYDDTLRRSAADSNLRREAKEREPESVAEKSLSGLAPDGSAAAMAENQQRAPRQQLSVQQLVANSPAWSESDVIAASQNVDTLGNRLNQAVVGSSNNQGGYGGGSSVGVRQKSVANVPYVLASVDARRLTTELLDQLIQSNRVPLNKVSQVQDRANENSYTLSKQTGQAEQTVMESGLESPSSRQGVQQQIALFVSRGQAEQLLRQIESDTQSAINPVWITNAQTANEAQDPDQPVVLLLTPR